MSANITPSLRSALERLRHGGAVNGILLGWRRQVLINALPFEEFRAEKLLLATHDLRDHFSSGGDRLAHTFWFGFDICHALVIHRGECTLVILHVRAEEADFLRRAGQTFLDDCQLLIEGLLTPSSAEASAPGFKAGFL
jgi:hypothetical protein